MQTNRAFKYGDGLFETLRVRDGRILYLKDHFIRLSNGLDILKMQNPNAPLSFDEFQKILTDFIRIQSDTNLRIRITFFRQEGGLYSPQQQDYHYQIEATVLQDAQYKLNTQGLTLGICTAVQLPIDQLSNLKTISALPYVLAGIEKQQAGWDDCFLINSKGNIAESIAANIFMVKGQQIYTPALTEGCIAGVMRCQIIRLANKLGLKLIETSIQQEDLLQADEIFLTNAIRGIQWVKQLATYPHKFGCRVAKQLLEQIECELSHF
ncbi:aminotransferase class IV [Aureispira anguillae]|uniref:branched-chain-amino-acid transaminase n=1 Tax=Aureispira anguillae TaxID=2864201 RepID=A0A915YBP7_9BACT|nr:aminotransferase class IV [Aureispira anguillae]BDS10078.1 aminotransferase class IV [Aureispira anguillae]